MGFGAGKDKIERKKTPSEGMIVKILRKGK